MRNRYYKKVDLGAWMKSNRWKDTTLAEELTKMGTPISHTGVWFWRRKGSKPQQAEMLKNLTKIAGFRSELFFLSKSQETRLKELSENYSKEASFKILFPV